MNLWDLLAVSQYTQVFEVYVTNIYDQNLFLGRGTRAELMAQEHEQTYGKDELLVFDHLQDDVDGYTLKGSSIVIYVRDKHYEEYLEWQYDDRYVKTWDRRDRTTRPYLTRYEVEHAEWDKSENRL